MHCFLLTKRFCVSVTLNAQVAFVGVLDFNHLFEVVVFVNFTRASLDELLTLLTGQLGINLLVHLDDRVFEHNTSWHGAPFGVLSTCAFSREESEVHLLELSQLHDRNGILWLTCLIVDELNGHHWDIRSFRVNISACDLVNVILSVVHSEIKSYRALLTISIHALALVQVKEVVDINAHKRNQAATMSQELVVESTGVLLDLNDVDDHCWDLWYDYSPEGIGDSQISVMKFELQSVVIDVYNLYFGNLSSLFVNQVWVGHILCLSRCKVTSEPLILRVFRLISHIDLLRSSQWSIELVIHFK